MTNVVRGGGGNVAASTPVARVTRRNTEEFERVLNQTTLSDTQKNVIFDTFFPGDRVALFGGAEPEADASNFDIEKISIYSDVLQQLSQVFTNRIREIANQINDHGKPAERRQLPPQINIDEKLDLLVNILVLCVKIKIFNNRSFITKFNLMLHPFGSTNDYFERVCVNLLSRLFCEKLEFSIGQVLMGFNLEKFSFSENFLIKIKEMGYVGAMFIGHCVKRRSNDLVNSLLKDSLFREYFSTHNTLLDHFKKQEQNTPEFKKDMLKLSKLRKIIIDLKHQKLLTQVFVKFYVAELVLFTPEQVALILQHNDTIQDLEKLVALNEHVPSIMKDNNNSVVARANKLVILSRCPGGRDLLIDMLTKADLVDSDSMQLLVLVCILIGEPSSSIIERIVCEDSKAIFCKFFESVQEKLAGMMRAVNEGDEAMLRPTFVVGTINEGDEAMLRPTFVVSTISHIKESLISQRTCELLLGRYILMFVKSNAQFRGSVVEIEQMRSTKSESKLLIEGDLKKSQQKMFERKRFELNILLAKETILYKQKDPKATQAQINAKHRDVLIATRYEILQKYYLTTTLITEFMKARIDYKRVILSLLPLVCNSDMNVIILDVLAEVGKNQEFHNQTAIIRAFVNQLDEDIRNLLSQAFETSEFERDVVLKEILQFEDRLAKAESPASAPAPTTWGIVGSLSGVNSMITWNGEFWATNDTSDIIKSVIAELQNDLSSNSVLNSAKLSDLLSSILDKINAFTPDQKIKTKLFVEFLARVTNNFGNYGLIIKFFSQLNIKIFDQSIFNAEQFIDAVIIYMLGERRIIKYSNFLATAEQMNSMKSYLRKTGEIARIIAAKISTDCSDLNSHFTTLRHGQTKVDIAIHFCAKLFEMFYELAIRDMSSMHPNSSQGDKEVSLAEFREKSFWFENVFGNHTVKFNLVCFKGGENILKNLVDGIYFVRTNKGSSHKWNILYSNKQKLFQLGQTERPDPNDEINIMDVIRRSPFCSSVLTAEEVFTRRNNGLVEHLAVEVGCVPSAYASGIIFTNDGLQFVL